MDDQLVTPVNHGRLSITVWPTYLGLSQGDPGLGPIPNHEPWGDINYNRGQIWWRTEDGMILGRAQVFVPKGVWTHFLFCSGCIQPTLMGANQLEQPIIFDRPGIIDVDPIHNQDVLPRLPA